MAGVGVEVERAQTECAAQIARVSAPELIVVAGDGAADRGQRVLELLASDPTTVRLPVLVICGPSYAPVTGGEWAGRVAVLAPEGGLDVCAQRIRALLARIVQTGLGPLTLQQVVDEIALSSRPASEPRLAAASPAPAASARSQATRERSPTLIGVPLGGVVIAPPKTAQPRPMVAPAPAVSSALAPTLMLPTPAPAPVAERSSIAEDGFDYDAADTVPPPPSTSEAAVAVTEVAAEGRRRSGPTPLTWSIEPVAAALSQAVRARKRLAHLPRAALIAGAAALVAGAGLMLASIAGPASGAEPTARTGSISAATSGAASVDPARARAVTARATMPASKASTAALTRRSAAGRAATGKKRKSAAELEAEDADEIGSPRHVRPDRQRKIALANTHVAEGHRLLKRGNLGLAEAAYMKAFKALPNYPRALAGVVRVHLRRKDGAEAVRWAKRLVDLQPRRSNNQLMLGDAWALRGDRTRARAAWNRAASYGNATARRRLKH